MKLHRYARLSYKRRLGTGDDLRHESEDYGPEDRQRLKDGTNPISWSLWAYTTKESDDGMMRGCQDKRVKCREYTI
ncbi:MAG: hypothetical protein WCC86_07775 [Methanoregula sp.]|uniref:hypothetical protein n=1 Tax=Methanoregula sp. TaxID=2052170 RepID=UPI003BB20796